MADERQTASTVDKWHGRLETPTVTTTTALNADLRDWPELAQVVRVERERRVKGVVSVEVAYFSTSLDRGQADAAHCSR